MSVVLTGDIGATSLRAALVDRAGRFVASRRRAAPAETVDGVRHELDAAAWWTAFAELAAELAAEAPAEFDAVEAVGICGVTRTQVIVDGAGRPLRKAITWRDTRAEPEMAPLLACLPAAHPERGRVNAFHPVARLAWVARHEPGVLEAAAAVIEPKDYINLRLTGRIATDPVSSARLLASAESLGGTNLLSAGGINPRIVPQHHAPTACVGTVMAGHDGALGRLQGRPVFCLANDTWAAVLGMGALRPGYAYNISGTTEVIGAVSAKAAEAEGLMSVDWGEGLHHLGGPSQNGADTVAWMLQLVGKAASEIGDATAQLLAEPRDPQPILFLPYLQGERTPHWDAALRGAALGLNRHHGATDFAWATLEGIAFLNRLVLERAEAALGGPVGEIRFGGGGAANETWCQIKADVCERPVVVGVASEPGLLGCAIAAQFGLGRHASLAMAQEKLVAIARRYAPRPEHGAIYRQLYALYRDAEVALRPLSHALSALDGRRTRLPGVAAVQKEILQP